MVACFLFVLSCTMQFNYFPFVWNKERKYFWTNYITWTIYNDFQTEMTIFFWCRKWLEIAKKSECFTDLLLFIDLVFLSLTQQYSAITIVFFHFRIQCYQKAKNCKNISIYPWTTSLGSIKYIFPTNIKPLLLRENWIYLHFKHFIFWFLNINLYYS